MVLVVPLGAQLVHEIRHVLHNAHSVVKNVDTGLHVDDNLVGGLVVLRIVHGFDQKKIFADRINRSAKKKKKIPTLKHLSYFAKKKQPGAFIFCFPPKLAHYLRVTLFEGQLRNFVLVRAGRAQAEFARANLEVHLQVVGRGEGSGQHPIGLVKILLRSRLGPGFFPQKFGHFLTFFQLSFSRGKQKNADFKLGDQMLI